MSHKIIRNPFNGKKYLINLDRLLSNLLLLVLIIISILGFIYVSNEEYAHHLYMHENHPNYYGD